MVLNYQINQDIAFDIGRNLIHNLCCYMYLENVTNTYYDYIGNVSDMFVVYPVL